MKYTASVAKDLAIIVASALFVGAFFELYQGFVAIREIMQ